MSKSVRRDGSRAVWCGRVSEGSVRENAGGQFLHRVNDSIHLRDSVDQNAQLSRATTRSRPRRNWSDALAFYAGNVGTHLAELAHALGVTADSLTALQVGWHPGQRFWSFPERDGNGRVIGINARYGDGSKKRLSGSKAGLTYADHWDTGVGPILLVEGASDTAALLTIGLSAVGRPSNRGGVDHLVDMLSDFPLEREIVVFGERDQKEDGKWPGMEGAVSTATKLAETLERPIHWALPPDNAKDSRAWLQSMPKLPADRLADLFLSGLDVKVVNAPITIGAEPESTITLDLNIWRSLMEKARLDSLGKPGVYLDRSPTGAGKSHVDFVAIQTLWGRKGMA
jgi:hypothetical protein